MRRLADISSDVELLNHEVPKAARIVGLLQLSMLTKFCLCDCMPPLSQCHIICVIVWSYSQSRQEGSPAHTADLIPGYWQSFKDKHLDHLLQVARIRYEQSSALLAEEQKELSEQEEQQLEALQQKRLADLVVRQCTTVLKSVLAHKVCHSIYLSCHCSNLCHVGACTRMLAHSYSIVTICAMLIR